MNDRSMPAFPGGVGLSGLRVYSGQALDGQSGGSPHVHMACTECYVVTDGVGRLQTMTVADGPEETPLRPGDVVWFTPGTIHRIVNDDGSLRVLVIMQNGGLPEAGDAVLTFPPEYLVDEATYGRAASIVGESGKAEESLARARRDLAVAGFTRLRERWNAGDDAALVEFLEAATGLVAPKLHRWRRLLAEGALAEARQTWTVLDDLHAGRSDHLRAARVSRIEPPDQPSLGMCGYLNAYDPIRIAGLRDRESAGG